MKTNFHFVEEVQTRSLHSQQGRRPYWNQWLTLKSLTSLTQLCCELETEGTVELKSDDSHCAVTDMSISVFGSC